MTINRYEIEVTSTVLVYVDAENEETALDQAYEKALWEVPYTSDAIITGVENLDKIKQIF